MSLKGLYWDQYSLVSSLVTHMVASSTPSASLPPGWVVQSIYAGGKGCRPEGAGWQGPALGSWQSPSIGTDWGMNRLRAALQRGPGDTSGWKTGPEQTMCARSPESQPYSWAASEEWWGQKRRLSPSTPLSWDLTWSTASSSGVPSARKMWTC